MDVDGQEAEQEAEQEQQGSGRGEPAEDESESESEHRFVLGADAEKVGEDDQDVPPIAAASNSAAPLVADGEEFGIDLTTEE